MLPNIRASLKYTADLGNYTVENKEKYPFLDFEHFKDFDNEKVWYLENIVQVEENNYKEEAIKKFNENPVVQTIVDYMKEIYPAYLENDEQVFFRVQNAKTDIRKGLLEYMQTYPDLQDNQVLIMGHSNFLKILTGTEVDSKWKAVDGWNFENSDVVEFDFPLEENEVKHPKMTEILSQTNVEE